MTAACTSPGAVHGLPVLDEGLRLFFLAAAAHAVIAPLAWIVVFGFDLPFARTVPVSQWHAHEMIFGTYGAALAGFLTSAVPEWTNTKRRQGRALLLLLGLWLPGRVIGVVGLDALLAVGAVTDLAFFGLLLWYVAASLIQRRAWRQASFAFWLAVMTVLEAGIHLAWLVGALDLAEGLLRAGLVVFVIFLSLALSRISVVVVNHALDPTGETTPYRPHPGRQNLSTGLAALYVAALLVAPQSTVPAYLALAAGAAFLDRLAEWFIGWAAFRAEVLALAAANTLAGIGLLLIGAAGLGAPIGIAAGIHMLAIGSLGTAVLAVFTIAGLRHTGRGLDLPWQARVALGLVVAAGCVRILPEMDVAGPVLAYPLGAVLWAAAFAVWASRFLPMLTRPSVTAD